MHLTNILGIKQQILQIHLGILYVFHYDTKEVLRDNIFPLHSS